jgi:predicted dehydrogenase
MSLLKLFKRKARVPAGVAPYTGPTLRTAVIGVGYLGRFHAEKYQLLPMSKLVAIADPFSPEAPQLAARLGCEHVTDYKTLIGKVDAVSIVTPTQTHFEIAAFFLAHKVHVLVEKPMTVTLEEAQKLIDLANEQSCVLQVGYLERFNPIILETQASLKAPKFIESTRIMEFNPRNKDVNVILDLMIHDIDLITTLVNRPIESIDASGSPVLSQDIDIANVRIRFEGGCVANVTASRISLKPQRKLRIFQEDAYVSLDLQLKEASILTKGSGELFPGIPNIDRRVIKASQSDALKDEISAFLTSILTQTKARVTGEDGKQSLGTALAITAQIQAQRSTYHD